MVALPAVLISTSLSIVLVPLVIRISHRNGWYDVANERKIHKGEVSRLGGVAIFLGFAAGLAGGIAFQKGFAAPAMGGSGAVMCAAGIALVFAIGLVDDFRNIPALWKAFGQVVAAVMVVTAGCVLTELYVPFLWKQIPLGGFAYPLTILWLVGMSNAVNLIDGMDGLAGGVSLIAAASYALIGIISGNPVLTLVSLALLGGAIGFLFFNFPPASVFMGDSGSLVLGFVLALLPLLPVSPQAAHISAIQPLTILFIPILDTGAAIIRRLMRGEPVHAPDREHLHHKLLDLGLSSRQVLAVIYGVAALLGGIAVSYRFLPKEAATIIFLCVCATGVASMRLLAVRHSRKVTPRHVTFTKPRGVAATTDPAEVEEARHDMDRAAR